MRNLIYLQNALRKGYPTCREKLVHSQNPNENLINLQTCNYFFLGFPFFRLLPVKADGVGGGFCQYACIQEKSIQPQQKRCSLNLKNGF